MITMLTPWLLLGVSMLLLALEFFLPGGIMATFGVVVYLIALFMGFSEFDGPRLAFFFVLSLALPPLVVLRALRHIRKSGDKNTFCLSSSQEGFQGVEYDQSLIGKTGKALTDLGPSGYALIEGKRVQVVSQTAYIEKGASVTVLSGRGAYLIVQQLQKAKGEEKE